MGTAASANAPVISAVYQALDKAGISYSPYHTSSGARIEITTGYRGWQLVLNFRHLMISCMVGNEANYFAPALRKLIDTIFDASIDPLDQSVTVMQINLTGFFNEDFIPALVAIDAGLGGVLKIKFEHTLNNVSTMWGIQ